MLLSEAFVERHRQGDQGQSFAGEEVLYIELSDGLIALVQSSVLEIHPWGSTVTALEKPDRMTMDY